MPPDSATIRIQPSFSQRDYDRFLALTGEVVRFARTDSERARFAMSEWAELRRSCKLTMPEICDLIGKPAGVVPYEATEKRLQVQFEDTEWEELRSLAEQQWMSGTLPMAMLARLVLLEWCQLRERTRDSIPEILRKIAQSAASQ